MPFAGSLNDLIAALDLERIEVDLFRGHSPESAWQRVFGGQVIAQALAAAVQTVEDRYCHSLHAYFLRPGDTKAPILYEVDRARDGGSFTARRVVAIQHGRQIFNMAASFQRDEVGLDHQDEMPHVPPPEGLPTERELRLEVLDKIPERYRVYFEREWPIELRPVDPQDLLNPIEGDPHQAIWLKTPGRIPADRALHQTILAFVSDVTLLGTATRPHAVSFVNPKMQAASLDHAMWFHRPFQVDDWLLYTQTSPSASGARGFSSGKIFSRDGRLVASVAQEGLIRLHD